MTTTDHAAEIAAAEIAAAEARLAAAKADVEDLRAQLAAEQAAEPTAPRLSTWEDGVAAARRRHPGRTRSEVAAAGTDNGDTGTDAVLDITTVAGARAEARRRAARRTGGAA